ncbi:probable sulfate transporter 3.5 [Prosopis cineraria]|uniref:probable sulfate transporter 3.5 n=1 Tax=Prosopis cineraria TaxID=364024 RepID=UPI00240F19EE|nr:probable sulfate transporter 3.5 [Prosopis cineraria]
MGDTIHQGDEPAVNLSDSRGFFSKFKAGLKETFFPDDPFRQFRNENRGRRRALKGLQYFIPIFEWLPKYSFRLLFSDLLAGLTITSLAIPQGISYAKLASIPPIVGLYSAFVPPIVYAVFGSSRHVAVGPIASCSLIIYESISGVVNPDTDPVLYLHLVYTSAFITGVFQAALGVLRLGILVDFFSHSTITGFMTGTAIILIFQQLKGLFGLRHFTTKTNVQGVIRAIWQYRSEIRWETTVLGLVLLIFLQFTRFVKYKNPKLFWVPALGPIITVVVSGVFTFLVKGENHGIQIVGHLDKGINPLSIHLLNFDSKYISPVLKAALITGILSLAEGIAIGRSFAVIDNTPHDGNKEMIAFGLMNLCGSFTSCYLTSGPFSKTAVNYNAGCKTAFSNIVQSVLIALTLQFLAPLFGYTPLVALAVIIISAMIGLLDYREMIHLFKVDKFDFVICMAGVLGVAFISMDVGLAMSVGLALLRALLYVARPATCKLGRLTDSGLYRDVEQYPKSSNVHGILIVQLGSPLYYANSNYIKERVLRHIRSEQASGDSVENLILDFSGVTSIDMTGIKGLLELRRVLDKNEIQISIVNPRREVVERLMVSNFVDAMGKDSFFLTLDEAVMATQYSLRKGSRKPDTII